jgi:hypothetical protein
VSQNAVPSIRAQPLRLRSKEPVHDTTSRCHEHAKPPPLICAPVAALEKHVVCARDLTTLDFARRGRRSNEGVEGGRGQHFRGRHGEVHGHEGCAVLFVKVEA